MLVSLVPTALARVGAEHFRTVVLGGSAPPGNLPANVVTTYGLTETGSGVVYGGIPLPGVEVAIDPDTGEIRLRGPMLLRGYRDGTEALTPRGGSPPGTPAASTPTAGCRSDGRLTEMIISGGENIWPAPVEAALSTHPVGGRGRGRRDGPTRNGASGWWPGSCPPTRPPCRCSTSCAGWSAETRRARLRPPASWSSSTSCPAPRSVRCSAPCCRPRSRSESVDQYSRADLTFEVSDTGPADGRAVILLHGFPEDRHCWDSLAGSLAGAGYRALAPDQRGYSPGARPAGRRAYALDQLAGDVLALADAAGVDRFDVVGHDWGAAVAWFLAGGAPRADPQPDGPLGPASAGRGGGADPQCPAAAVVVHAVLPAPGGTRAGALLVGRKPSSSTSSSASASMASRPAGTAGGRPRLVP